MFGTERIVDMIKKLCTVIISMFCLVGLCACGGSGADEKKVPELSPSDILSVEEAAEFTGYAMIQDGEMVYENGTKSVVYVSNPKGESDSVTVKITQYGDTMSKDEVWNRYDTARIKRESAVAVEGIGTDAYVAFPYIHIYDKGCDITIAAGSGSDEGQKALLERIGERAVMNLARYITE